MYDGRVFLMQRWSIENKTLRGKHFETDFSAFMAWRDFGFPDQNVRNCFGMAALRAAKSFVAMNDRFSVRAARNWTA